LLVEHLKRTVEANFCAETIRSLLHRLGFRWRRPRWAVMRDDPQKAERMWAIARAILSAATGTVVLIEDETIFRSLPPLRRMWMRLGQQVRIPTPFQNHDTCLYGALALDSGACVYAFHDKAKSENTIAYLEQLLAHYPDQPILLIWDQATFHTSQLVEAWLADQPRLTTMLLPKYAPDLNPIEDVWQVLKDRVAANLTRSIKAIQAACDRFFDEQRPVDLLRMAGLIS
jgi:transposase